MNDDLLRQKKENLKELLKTLQEFDDSIKNQFPELVNGNEKLYKFIDITQNLNELLAIEQTILKAVKACEIHKIKLEILEIIKQLAENCKKLNLDTPYNHEAIVTIEHSNDFEYLTRHKRMAELASGILGKNGLLEGLLLPLIKRTISSLFARFKRNKSK